MTLEELDFDDEPLMDETNPNDQTTSEEEDKPWVDYSNHESEGMTPVDNQTEQVDNDVLTRVLESKGINPEAVRIQNENGEVEEINFYDLSPEEQLDLVNGTPQEDYSLEADEIGFLNHLRDNNLSVNDYLEYYKRRVIEEYQNGLQDNAVYDIDSFSDDELFIADLKDKKIAAQSGTFHLDALTSQTEAKANEMADFTTMLIGLKAGTIEGYVAEEPTAMAVCEDKTYDYIKFVNNDTGFKVEDDEVSIAVGVKKGSELKDKINGALKDFGTDAQKELMAKMVAIAPSEE